MYPRSLGAVIAGILSVCVAVFVERRWRLASLECAALERRGALIPNYNHLWWAHDMVFVNGRSGELCDFGAEACRNLDWSLLCRLDPDADGRTNGEELGDPCCRWSAFSGARFSLSRHQEYRRWGLAHPGGDSSDPLPAGLDVSPPNCSNYDPSVYAEQFRTFYFRNAEGPHEPTPLVAAQVVGLAILVALVGHWARHRGLCSDVAPWLSQRAHLSPRTSLAVALASFLYMDVTSGMVHLILDYAPHWLPGLGGLARGFQFHHHDPTAIVRISWYAYVAHVHLLCPIVGALLMLSAASRVQRLFWFWGAVFVHLFQTTHRWAHFRPEQLPWLVRLWQGSGLLLTHERHMSHHEDLERQFTILSGHTDVLLDAAAALVPPIRYDIWLFIGSAWFILPVALDIRFRRFFEALEHAPRSKSKIMTA